jgi:hypothetical protein
MSERDEASAATGSNAPEGEGTRKPDRALDQRAAKFGASSSTPVSVNCQAVKSRRSAVAAQRSALRIEDGLSNNNEHSTVPSDPVKYMLAHVRNMQAKDV